MDELTIEGILALPRNHQIIKMIHTWYVRGAPYSWMGENLGYQISTMKALISRLRTNFPDLFPIREKDKKLKMPYLDYSSREKEILSLSVGSPFLQELSKLYLQGAPYSELAKLTTLPVKDTKRLIIKLAQKYPKKFLQRDNLKEILESGKKLQVPPISKHINCNHPAIIMLSELYYKTKYDLSELIKFYSIDKTPKNQVALSNIICHYRRICGEKMFPKSPGKKGKIPATSKCDDDTILEFSKNWIDGFDYEKLAKIYNRSVLTIKQDLTYFRQKCGEKLFPYKRKGIVSASKPYRSKSFEYKLPSYNWRKTKCTDKEVITLSRVFIENDLDYAKVAKIYKRKEGTIKQMISALRKHCGKKLFPLRPRPSRHTKLPKLGTACSEEAIVKLSEDWKKHLSYEEMAKLYNSTPINLRHVILAWRNACGKDLFPTIRQGTPQVESSKNHPRLPRHIKDTDCNNEDAVIILSQLYKENGLSFEKLAEIYNTSISKVRNTVNFFRQACGEEMFPYKYKGKRTTPISYDKKLAELGAQGLALMKKPREAPQTPSLISRMDHGFVRGKITAQQLSKSIRPKELDNFVQYILQNYAPDDCIQYISEFEWDIKSRPYKEVTRHIVAERTQKPKKNLLVLPSDTGRDVTILRNYRVDGPNANWLAIEKNQDYLNAFLNNMLCSDTVPVDQIEAFNGLFDEYTKQQSFDFIWLDLTAYLGLMSVKWLQSQLSCAKNADFFLTVLHSMRDPWGIARVLYKALTGQTAPASVKKDFAKIKSKIVDTNGNKLEEAKENFIVVTYLLLRWIFQRDFNMNVTFYHDTSAMALVHLANFSKQKPLNKNLQQYIGYVLNLMFIIKLSDKPQLQDLIEVTGLDRDTIWNILIDTNLFIPYVKRNIASGLLPGRGRLFGYKEDETFEAFEEHIGGMILLYLDTGSPYDPGYYEYTKQEAWDALKFMQENLPHWFDSGLWDASVIDELED